MCDAPVLQHNRGLLHGNLTCKNVMVCAYNEDVETKNALVVKLADPGLLHYYNMLGNDHEVNKSR